MSKETELALWQKKTLDSCVEYKQGLIHLSAQIPSLASLAVDEKYVSYIKFNVSQIFFFDTLDTKMHSPF